MAMNRSQMRRQLYRGGGIASLPRQGYGLGDWVRKLIPNELADIAVKAAPFVAPFNPGIAGLMRGIGRYDQRGSLSDALKQGLLTTGLGAGARYLGGAEKVMGGGLTGEFTSPMGPDSPISRMWGNVTGADTPATTAGTRPPDFVKGVGDTSKAADFFAGAKEKWDKMGKLGKLGTVFAGSTLVTMAVQAAMGDVGKREPGESLEAFNTRRKGTVSKYLDFYFRRANKFRIAPENMDAEAAKFVADNTKEYVSEGGRVGLFGGGEASIKSLEAGAPEITYKGDMRMASAPDPMEMLDTMAINEFGKLWKDLTNEEKDWLNEMGHQEGRAPVKETAPQGIQMAAQGGRIGYTQGGILELALEDAWKTYKKRGGTLSKEEFADGWMREMMKKSQGGRIGYRFGLGPVAQGLPGIPRMAEDGLEYDMSQNGGFQPLGAKEGKDDVKANLAKNEFVFTADAVRGAGNGDIELGAQKMYDTMKNLERRVV